MIKHKWNILAGIISGTVFSVVMYGAMMEFRLAWGDTPPTLSEKIQSIMMFFVVGFAGTAIVLEIIRFFRVYRLAVKKRNNR